uniref:Ribonuclease H-like domain-containing protein n=1 Tax=Tanacetum cinerariifolium TaxID=118510 RepID=A0A6L2J4B9_TANCI|nr:ribonuclease H-like domain-containing protein [Tanacetum cinerariifolium]
MGDLPSKIFIIVKMKPIEIVIAMVIIRQSLDDKDADEVPDKGDEGYTIIGRNWHDDVYDDREVSVEADTNNLILLTVVSPIPTKTVHKDHLKEKIIGDLNLATQTRIMHSFSEESNGFLDFCNLNFKVKEKDDGIFISQDKYMADILKKFDFTTVKTASTLMEPNKALIKDVKSDDVDVIND